MSAETKRAAIYRRVSSDKQEKEGASLDEQARLCRELAEREGYEVPARALYTDVLSGADPERPGFNRMMDDAVAGRFQAVAIYALDRFGREVVQVVTALKTLDAAGVTVLPVRGHIDRSTPEGQMMTTIEAAFGEWERAKIKVRTRMGIAGKQRDGKPWGNTGYGYRKAAEPPWWVQEPAEVQVYARLVRHRLQDSFRYHTIAVRLNRAHVRTRSGGRWSALQVQKILESKHALGYFKARGEWVRGGHGPIIDQATWDALQARTAHDRKLATSRGGRRPRHHLFVGGHLRCAECGAPMWTRSGRTSDGDVYYCATNHGNGAGTCPVAPSTSAWTSTRDSWRSSRRRGSTWTPRASTWRPS